MSKSRRYPRLTATLFPLNTSPDFAPGSGAVPISPAGTPIWYLILASALYAALYSIAFLAEAANAFDRFGAAASTGAKELFPLMFTVSLIALLVHRSRIKNGREGGLSMLSLVFFGAAAASFAFAARTLPATSIAIFRFRALWVTAYSDTMRPQWGGRYALTSGAILAVGAVVVLAGRRVALAAVLAVSFVVTGYGVVFLSQRSHSIADGMTAIVARHDAAVISLEAHLLREGERSTRPTVTGSPRPIRVSCTRPSASCVTPATASSRSSSPTSSRCRQTSVALPAPPPSG